jgi:hypothetical protein
VEKIRGSDAIMEHILTSEPNFDDLANLTQMIESGTSNFIAEMSDLIQLL